MRCSLPEKPCLEFSAATMSFRQSRRRRSNLGGRLVYYGFFAGAVPNTYDALSRTASIDEFRAATRGLVAGSQNYAAADEPGNILSSSYQGTPCRGYLNRDAEGNWKAGADPNQLLDGSRYGAFKIPVKDGGSDETEGASDPYSCVVPFDKMPAAMNPARGYVFTANNDPGNISTDSTFANDPYYIGGPWDIGYRANTISTECAMLSRNARQI